MYRHVLSGILALLGLGVVAPAEAEVALPPDITVAADGSGDFRTVQEALNSIPRDNKQRMIVLIKDGVYRGQVRVGRANAGPDSAADHACGLDGAGNQR